MPCQAYIVEQDSTYVLLVSAFVRLQGQAMIWHLQYKSQGDYGNCYRLLFFANNGNGIASKLQIISCRSYYYRMALERMPLNEAN